jgi:hypothetical protein
MCGIFGAECFKKGKVTERGMNYISTPYTTGCKVLHTVLLFKNDGDKKVILIWGDLNLMIKMCE